MGNPYSDPKHLWGWGGRPPWLVANKKTRSRCFSWPCFALAQTRSQLIQPYRKLIQPKKLKGIVLCCRKVLNQFEPTPTKAGGGTRGDGTLLSLWAQHQETQEAGGGLTQPTWPRGLLASSWPRDSFAPGKMLDKESKSPV